MPETSIDEHGNLCGAKSEIGFPRKPLMATPATDFVFAQQGDQTQLGLLVADAANARHDGRPFCGREDVRHRGVIFRLPSCILPAFRQIRRRSNDRRRWCLFSEMPLHVGGHHADLRDCVFQLLLGDSEMLGPVSQLPSFVDVDPDSVGRTFFL